MRLDYLLQTHRAPLPLKKAQQRIRADGLWVDGRLVREPKHHIVPGVERVTDGSGEDIAGSPQLFCVLNKPAGRLSQRHPTEPSVYDLIPPELQRSDLAAFGRLDRDTTGMLLLGTDGGVQSLLLSPNSRVWKSYTATLADGVASLASDAAAAFAAGLALEDGTECRPATLELIDEAAVRVTLHEGFFHQVKRMLAAVGGTVASLHRDRFGEIADPDLAPGAMRPLTPAELRALVGMLPDDRLGDKPSANGRRPAAPAPAAPEPAGAAAAGREPGIGGAAAGKGGPPAETLREGARSPLGKRGREHSVEDRAVVRVEHT